jgi:hypothetical protein
VESDYEEMSPLMDKIFDIVGIIFGVCLIIVITLGTISLTALLIKWFINCFLFGACG